MKIPVKDAISEITQSLEHDNCAECDERMDCDWYDERMRHLDKCAEAAFQGYRFVDGDCNPVSDDEPEKPEDSEDGIWAKFDVTQDDKRVDESDEWSDFIGDILDDVLATVNVSDKTIDMIRKSQFHAVFIEKERNTIHSTLCVVCVLPTEFLVNSETFFPNDADDEDIMGSIFELVRDIVLKVEDYNTYVKLLFKNYEF